MNIRKIFKMYFISIYIFVQRAFNVKLLMTRWWYNLNFENERKTKEQGRTAKFQFELLNYVAVIFGMGTSPLIIVLKDPLIERHLLRTLLPVNIIKLHHKWHWLTAERSLHIHIRCTYIWCLQPTCKRT